VFIGQVFDGLARIVFVKDASGFELFSPSLEHAKCYGAKNFRRAESLPVFVAGQRPQPPNAAKNRLCPPMAGTGNLLTPIKKREQQSDIP
jgi:hypothetical protein